MFGLVDLYIKHLCEAFQVISVKENKYNKKSDDMRGSN